MKHRDIAHLDYFWYDIMFEIENRLPNTKRQAYERLLEGIEKYPDVVRFYYMGARFLLPEWGGSWQHFNGWVEEAVRRTRDRHGLGIYAHIYLHLRRHSDVYIQPQLWPEHWARIKQGIADIKRMSPHAKVDDWVLIVACAARDEVEIAKYRGLTQAKGDQRLMSLSARDYCGWDSIGRSGFSLQKLPIPNIP